MRVATHALQQTHLVKPRALEISLSYVSVGFSYSQVQAHIGQVSSSLHES